MVPPATGVGARGATVPAMTDRNGLPALPPIDPAAADHGAPASTTTPELLAGLLADGDDELAAWAITNALRELPRAAVYDGVVRDAMRLVGQRWVDGEWGIAEEHLASRTLARALDRVAPDPGPAGRIGPLAIIGGLQGEHHVIGLICLAHVLTEAGWSVSDLGPDEPAEDLGRYVGRTRPALVALTASAHDRLPVLADAVGAVRRAAGDRPPAIMLGGRIAEDPGRVADLGIDWVGTSLASAAGYARALRDRLDAEGWSPADEEAEDR
jgi:methanogenic corrinoid protein MtbC1